MQRKLYLQAVPAFFLLRLFGADSVFPLPMYEHSLSQEILIHFPDSSAVFFTEAGS